MDDRPSSPELHPQRHEMHPGNAPADVPGGMPLLPECETLDDVVRLVSQFSPLFVRFSKGPLHDASERSVDTESNLTLPGLSVNPLQPETWWSRPTADWVARQLCAYEHLRQQNAQRFPWILTGREIARGPDCEPLLVEITPLATISSQAMAEASERYRERFAVGRGPED